MTLFASWSTSLLRMLHAARRETHEGSTFPTTSSPCPISQSMYVPLSLIPSPRRPGGLHLLNLWGQIGGSLAKVIYFTRSTNPPSSPSQIATRGSTPSHVFTPISISPPRDSPISSPHPRHNGHNHNKGALTPAVLEHCNGQATGSAFRNAVPPHASEVTSASKLSSQDSSSTASLSP